MRRSVSGSAVRFFQDDTKIRFGWIQEESGGVRFFPEDSKIRFGWIREDSGSVRFFRFVRPFLSSISLGEWIQEDSAGGFRIPAVVRSLLLVFFRFVRLVDSGICGR